MSDDLIRQAREMKARLDRTALYTSAGEQSDLPEDAAELLTALIAELEKRDVE
jgi:hypothetical protein